MWIYRKRGHVGTESAIRRSETRPQDAENHAIWAVRGQDRCCPHSRRQAWRLLSRSAQRGTDTVPWVHVEPSTQSVSFRYDGRVSRTTMRSAARMKRSAASGMSKAKPRRPHDGRSAEHRAGPHQFLVCLGHFWQETEVLAIGRSISQTALRPPSSAAARVAFLCGQPAAVTVDSARVAQVSCSEGSG